MKPSRNPDKSINLDERSSAELKRKVVSQEELSLQDSAVIPNIEQWLKGRSSTGSREILKHPFEDETF
jgi:hypothetical protein